MTRQIMMILTLLTATIVTIAFSGSKRVVEAADKTKIERFTQPYDETIPAAFTCSGEDVHVSGVLELMVHTTVDSRGGVHAVFHVTPRLTAIGVTSGLTYRTAGPFQSVSNASPTDQYEFHLTNTIVLISPGSTDNLVLHENMQVTVNANGVTTAEIDEFRAECRG